MSTYWFLFLLPAFWRLMAGFYLQMQKFGVVVIGIVLVLVIGLRDRVGCDWFNYLNGFNDIATTSFSDASARYETGHVVVNKLADTLGFGVEATNFFYAIIFVVGLMALVRRQPIPWLTLLLAVPYLINVVGMGYTRQATAIGFLCFAFIACAERRVFVIVFFVIAAGMFHRSALMFLILIPIARGFRLDFINLAMLPFPFIGFYFMQRDVDQYISGYVNSGMVSDGSPVRLLLTASAGVLFLFFRKRFALYADYSIMLLFTILALVSLPLGMVASTAADRMALYLLPFQIVVFARLPLFFRDPRLQQGATAAIVAVFALQQFVWLNYASNAGCWVPYRNFLFGSIRPPRPPHALLS